jgi:hypothetical protein
MPFESLGTDDMPASPSPQSSGVQSIPAPPPPLEPLHDPADEPSFMQRTWHTIAGIPEGLWNLGTGVATGIAHPVDTADARNEGLKRGVRDLTDRVSQYGSPEYGVPIPDDPAAIGKQNAADRAAFDAKYGDSPVAQAGRTVGNIAITTPITAALSGPLSVLMGAGRAALPAMLTRGAPGLATSTVERAVTGGAQGGVQAATTADPSKPLLPQVEAGATTGAVTPAATGVVTDPVSTAVSRLRGNTIRTNPRLGGLPQDQIDRATQADELVKAGVPVMGSQVSSDPLLQTSSKYLGGLPGSGMQDFLEAQSEKYRQAVLKQAGDTSDSALVNDAYKTTADTRIGNLYNNSVGSVGAIPGAGIASGMDAVRSQMSPALKPEDTARVNSMLNHVQNTFNKGPVSGADYQVLVRDLGTLFNSDEPDVRAAAWRIKQELDGRAQSVMTPDQIDAFKAANDQFRANKTLQAVAGSDGKFTPGDLWKETARVNDNYGGGKAPGVLDRIAQTGNTVIQPTLSSGLGTTGRVLGSVGGGTLAASIPTAAALKLATIDALTTGGAGLLGLGTGVGANRVLQGQNFSGGPRAIATSLRGGGPPSLSELAQALQTLRLGTQTAVAANRNQSTSQ